ncbi:ABC transporter permease subunit [Halosimplex pelagicum]|uniref:ABC transporter permease subunit n=1 Tax=Halosimplex pelagicum TaxID=869886 RepID=A0A7D5TA19_9EURY|nr:ABC transporter permease subunit [Halosimplex pelagicum]QLH80953.1 ABC transporter permease subunit [Halosimplex pelagicum]
MLEIARYEGRHRVRGTLVTAVAIGGFALMYVVLYPTFAESLGADIDALLDAYPEALQKTFGIQTLATMEGFLASELYTFVWMLLLGLYFAYSAASLIAADVERERMDMLLSLPVSRARVVAEKFVSLLVPLVVLNAVVPAVVYAGTVAVDYPVDPVDLLVLHALSVPYLLTFAGVGLVASVVFDRASVAQRVALGALAGLFFAESLLTDTDFAWIGAVSPTRYLDPNAVLIDGEYALADGAVLAVAAAALLGLAVVLFRRKDIE